MQSSRRSGKANHAVDMTSRATLENRRILITRRTEQSREMAAEIERLGGVPILAPMIEIADPESWADTDRAIADIKQFDALIFASANAAERFLGRCGEHLPRLSAIPILAVGDRTRASIRRFGLESGELPEQFSARGLAESVGTRGMKNRRVLLPRGDQSREDLPRLLSELGAIVESIVVYRTIRPPDSDATILREQLGAGKIDVVTFASPSAVANFVELLGPGVLTLLGGHAIIAAIGPTTAEAARHAGFSVAVTAEESTGPGLVRAIAGYFQ